MSAGLLFSYVPGVGEMLLVFCNVYVHDLCARASLYCAKYACQRVNIF